MKMLSLSAIALAMIVPLAASAIPSPSTFAKAELRAIADYETTGRDWILLGELVSIEKQGQNSNYNNIYEVVSTQQGKNFCVEVTVKSQMVTPSGNARSSDEVEAKVIKVTPFRECS